MISRSIIQCPQCGFKVTESFTAEPRLSYTCPACEVQTQVKPEQCCIYCVYGSQKCEKQQQTSPK